MFRDMSWESRKSGGRYYTRSKRINGQIIREYVGGGLAGELAAAMDQEERSERESQVQELRKTRTLNADLDLTLCGYFQTVNTVSNWLMLAAGCHRPKRQWRKKRDHRIKDCE